MIERLLPASHVINVARFQASMLRSLKDVQADDSIVGFYQAMTLGSFLNQTLVETQAIHQEKLRHGGVVIVHGNCRPRVSLCRNSPTRGQTCRRPLEGTRLSARSA